MPVVFLFALLLLLATLISELANRSVLSLTVLFLAGGAIAGNSGLFAPVATDPLLRHWTEAALFFILFLDGMRLTVHELSRPGHWPARALLIGLPLSIAVTAFLAHYVLSLQWAQSFLLGALLSPTDPVLISAIVGTDALPEKLRHFLRVESGLNDGLALPFVFVLLRSLQAQPLGLGGLLIQIAGGLVAGIGIVWIAVTLARRSAFRVSREYEPLFVSAVGLMVLSAASIIGLNPFLGAYAGGITLTTLSGRARKVFSPFGEVITELLKLSGIFLFGTLLRPDYATVSWPVSLFAVTVLVIPRSTALAVSFLGSGISIPEFWTAAWFGPRGFASMLYAIYVLLADVPHAEEVFHAAAIVIVASVVAHSSTDVAIANWFRRKHQA